MQSDQRKHGGNIYEHMERYGTEPLDFSASINPFGLSGRVQATLAASFAGADRYPDPECRALRRKLADYYRQTAAGTDSNMLFEPDCFLIGNGAADLIYRIAYGLRPQKALLLSPGFSEYESALSAAGCDPVFYPLRAKNGFRIEEDILDHITSDINLVMIAEPNNPTGLTAGRALLRKILHKCEEADAVLVVDESFLDFCYPYQSTTFKTVTVKNSVVRNILSDPDGYRILNPDSMLYSRIRPDEAGRLLVLRSLTKICALAGIRLGFACSSNPALLAVIGQAGAPWSVSSPAQAAGLAAVSESFLPPDQLSIISSERERVLHDLRGLGMEVLPGEANFLLFYCKRHDLADRLAEQGILIRSCRNFRGLGEGWFRTARRLPEENDRLLQAMEEVLAAY